MQLGCFELDEQRTMVRTMLKLLLRASKLCLRICGMHRILNLVMENGKDLEVKRDTVA